MPHARPSVSVVAPGRVNLIGEHIDYVGGVVMPLAIDRHVRMRARVRPGDECRISTEISGEEKRGRIHYSDLSPRSEPGGAWLDYLVGVLALTRDEGAELPGLEVSIESDLSSGAGLSSSAALETAFSLALDTCAGLERTVLERARLCQRAEHEFAGVPCGIMDQLAVGAAREGTVLRLDCETGEWGHVKLPEDWSLVIADTGVKHALGDGEYRGRREDCEAVLERLGAKRFRDLAPEDIDAAAGKLGDRLHRRARHVVTEMARVRSFGEALEAADADLAGRLLLESHRSLRDDYEVSCRELDFLVEVAHSISPERGRIGSRMTGGGFGGSTISLVRRENAPEFRDELREKYREFFGRDLECFISRSVAGATVESADGSGANPPSQP